MIFAIFQEVVQKHEKVPSVNFGRLPVGQFSLDLKKFRIWATFLRSNKIRNVVWPPSAPPLLLNNEIHDYSFFRAFIVG